jgi:predicted RND superfamily exporter protein
MPAKAADLERALREVGFAPDRFQGVIEGMRHPSSAVVSLNDLSKGAASILISRYLGEDSGEHLVAMYVRPNTETGSIDRVEDAVRHIDPKAMLTGYSRLEVSLRETLRHDLPRIGLVAFFLVALALAASLRRPRDVALAGLVVTSEIAAVLLLIRAFSIPLHAYDALVIPVLLGITVDEAMFLLHRARDESALFDGLRDLGLVGALGSTVGLVVALLVVPAGLRLFGGLNTAPKAPPSGIGGHAE